MTHTEQIAPHSRVVKRPVRRNRYRDGVPDGVDDHVRFECLECGKESQGHPQAVDLVLRERGCENTPERYRVGDAGGDE